MHRQKKSRHVCGGGQDHFIPEKKKQAPTNSCNRACLANVSAFEHTQEFVQVFAGSDCHHSLSSSPTAITNAENAHTEQVFFLKRRSIPHILLLLMIEMNHLWMMTDDSWNLWMDCKWRSKSSFQVCIPFLPSQLFICCCWWLKWIICEWWQLEPVMGL